MIHRIVDDIAVIVFDRETLDVGDLEALGLLVGTLLQQGVEGFVVNLGNVSNPDSHALGHLVGVYAKVTKRGGDMVLCCGDAIVASLNTFKLGHWSCFETEEAAIAGIKRRRME